LRSKGVWEAKDRASGNSVLVDGPYKTNGEADAAAHSRSGAESAARGGLYVVSAALSSHLAAQVRKVANCLGGSGGSGGSSSQVF
jgi:hypothetical protein